MSDTQRPTAEQAAEVITHDWLVDRARRWLLNSPRMHSYKESDYRSACPIVFTEVASIMRETPDAIGWYSGVSFLVECKTSRSDFHADKRKAFRKTPDFGMGVFRYYMAPEGIIGLDDLPDRWGLLTVLGNRHALRIDRHAERQEASLGAELEMMISVFRRLSVRPDSCVSLRYRAFTRETKNTATASVVRLQTKEKGTNETI